MSFDYRLINDITNNLDGKRIPLNESQRQEKQQNELYPYIGANNILCYIDDYIFNEEILCIAEDGGSWGINENCSFIINEKCWVNNHAHVLTPKNGVELSYLKYYLNHTDLTKYITGTTRGKLTKTALNRIQIPLPPLETQKKIAAILDKADELRHNDQKILKKYDQLAQSVFLEMFGDPVTNPKGWEKCKLKNIGEIITGNTPSRNIIEYYGNYIEWIKTDNINTPYLCLTKAEEYLSEKGLEKGRTVESGALLVTCIAGSKSVIGNVALTNRKVSFNQQINALQPKVGKSLFWYYQFIVAKKYVQSFSTNSMKGMISKGKFETIEFIYPRKEIQEKFEKLILSIEQQKQLTQQSLQKSKELFQSLLQRAFKGELVKHGEYNFKNEQLSEAAENDILYNTK